MWSYEGIKGEIRDMISFKIDLFVKNFSTWFMTCCHSFCGSSKRLQEEFGRRKKSGVPHLKTGFCAFSKKKGERIHGLHFWPWFAFRDPDGPAYHPTYKWHHLSRHHILDHFELWDRHQTHTHTNTNTFWVAGYFKLHKSMNLKPFLQEELWISAVDTSRMGNTVSTVDKGAAPDLLHLLAVLLEHVLLDQRLSDFFCPPPSQQEKKQPQ